MIRDLAPFGTRPPRGGGGSSPGYTPWSQLRGDAYLFQSGNASNSTATVISAVSTPTLVNGNNGWLADPAMTTSGFFTVANGTAVYTGATVDRYTRIVIAGNVRSASSTTVETRMYLYKTQVQVAATVAAAGAANNNFENLLVEYEMILQPFDNLQIFCSNETNTDNLIFTSLRMSVI